MQLIRDTQSSQKSMLMQGDLRTQMIEMEFDYENFIIIENTALCF